MDLSVLLDFQLPNASTWFYFSLFLTVALFFRFSRPWSLRNFDLLALFLMVPGLLVLQYGGAGRTGDRSTAMLAYGWLLAANAYWLGRLLYDLALPRRPLMHVNLATAGMVCLGIGLFVGLAAVAMQRPASEHMELGKQPPLLEQMGNTTAVAVRQSPLHDAAAAVPPRELRLLCLRTMALACHAFVVAALILIGRRHFQDLTLGVVMATLYLLLPYTAYCIDQLHHVWPAAFIIAAVLGHRRPLASGILLGVAAVTSIVPAFLWPLWWGYYKGRGSGRFLFGCAAAAMVTFGLTGSIYWLETPSWRGIVQALHLWEWLPWQAPTSQSIWTSVHWSYRLPVFVVFVGWIIAVTFWPQPKQLHHLVAQSAAVLIGVQFWHGDNGGIYVLWYLPLLIVAVCRPTLSEWMSDAAGWTMRPAVAASPGSVAPTPTKPLAV